METNRGGDIIRVVLLGASIVLLLSAVTIGQVSLATRVAHAYMIARTICVALAGAQLCLSLLLFWRGSKFYRLAAGICIFLGACVLFESAERLARMMWQE
jgi:hypothetical protein